MPDPTKKINTTVSFDLTPEQLRILTPLFVLHEAAPKHFNGAIWARISPVGIADADFHAQVKVAPDALFVVVTGSQLQNVLQFDSPDAVNFKFGDGTKLSVIDAGKEANADVHDYSEKLAA